jgi:uncharacterized protein (TIGR04255 family)
MIMIDRAEQFELLACPPIAEAVIELRSPVEWKWDKISLKAELSKLLPDYPKSFALQTFAHQMKISAEGKSDVTSGNVDFNGIRIQTDNGKHVAQFRRDAFAYSHLRPYASWQVMFDEMKRLWSVYSTLTKPTKLDRIGVRFINQIPLQGRDFRSLLQGAPTSSELIENMPIVNFLHQDNLAVPGHPYAITIRKTIQQPTMDILIIDIDVCTLQSVALDEIDEHLANLRWLKNKVFFSVLSQKAIEGLK